MTLNIGLEARPNASTTNGYWLVDAPLSRSSPREVFRSEQSSSAGNLVKEARFRRFKRLAKRWKEQTILMSSVEDMVMNENYQQIIGMGPDAVPFILKEMRETPGFWFWALRAITGTNPVRKNDLGNMEKMTQSWLEWGRIRGLLDGV